MWRTWKKRRIIRTVWVNPTGYLLQLCQIVIFSPIFCLLCIQTVSDVGPYQNICWKNSLYIHAELAGHVGYINLTWNGKVYVGMAFLCLLCAWSPNLTTLKWIDQQHCENKNGVHFFTLKFKCHNRYKKLSLCNSENGDIAWCNKITSE